VFGFGLAVAVGSQIFVVVFFRELNANIFTVAVTDIVLGE
jgi:hypothetical protein